MTVDVLEGAFLQWFQGQLVVLYIKFQNMASLEKAGHPLIDASQQAVKLFDCRGGAFIDSRRDTSESIHLGYSRSESFEPLCNRRKLNSQAATSGCGLALLTQRNL